MFNFDIKKTRTERMVRWAKLPLFRFSKILKKLFLFFLILDFSFLVYEIFFQKYPLRTIKRLIGAMVIFLVVYLWFLLLENFLKEKIKKVRPKFLLSKAASFPERYNLAELLSFQTASAVIDLLNCCSKNGVLSSHLLYFLLKGNKRYNFIFNRLLLDKKEIEKEIRKEIDNSLSLEIEEDDFPFSKGFQLVILNALKIAQKKGREIISEDDILLSLAENDFVFKKIMINRNIRKEDIKNLIDWLEDVEEKIEKEKRFWDYDNLIKKGSLAKTWSAGYTINLDKYSHDITEMVKGKNLQFVGHEKELEEIERILSEEEINNVLMVGEPGTGKRSLIYSLAQRSSAGKSFPEINYKRIVELDLPSLLAEIESIEEVESVLDLIFQEVAWAGNIILLIDEFQNYVSQQFKAGTINISGLIAPYLKLSQFHLIAISTLEGFHRYIEKNSLVLSLFKKVEINGISKEETFLLLEKFVFSYEKKYKIFISYPALRQIVDFSDRYFPSLPFPEKAIDVLDGVVVYVFDSLKEKIVLPKHIAKIVTEKTEIPVGKIEENEKSILLNLENLIHQKIINQKEAVKDIAVALRRARADVFQRKGPMGTFLFLGPTGVGKTETAKALAETYFGSEDNMIRLDMSEFQSESDVERIIGSLREEGILTTKVREKPFSLVLLDEIEKAHKNVLNLFLQVLDEGYLKDGLGRKVSFKDTIIIATGNAGYKIILEALRNKMDWQEVKQKILDYIFDNEIFRPEFVNRFDAFVVFKPLSKQNLLDISELMLNKVKKNLEKKGVEFIITEGVKEEVVRLGYNPSFGAREMKRVIQDNVEDILANGLLSGELKRGEKVTIDIKNKRLLISSNI